MATDEQKPFPSVWTRPRQGRREQPTLSREQIVAEAVRLLDDEGIDALSMRRLGARLDAAPTSLYIHVANKDELIELVVDEIYGELQVPDMSDAAHWREAVSTCAQRMRATMLRHTWIASVLGGTGMAGLGPNLMRLSEQMLALLESAGFSLTEANSAMNAVFSYVIGATTSEAAWLAMLARSGQTEQQWNERLGPAVEHAVRSHPRLRALYGTDDGHSRALTREDEFDHGLSLVLDGLAGRRASG